MVPPPPPPPLVSSSSSASLEGPVVIPTDHDVHLGRGRGCTNHFGNILLEGTRSHPESCLSNELFPSLTWTKFSSVMRRSHQNLLRTVRQRFENHRDERQEIGFHFHCPRHSPQWRSLHQILSLSRHLDPSFRYRGAHQSGASLEVSLSEMECAAPIARRGIVHHRGASLATVPHADQNHRGGHHGTAAILRSATAAGSSSSSSAPGPPHAPSAHLFRSDVADATPVLAAPVPTPGGRRDALYAAGTPPHRRLSLSFALFEGCYLFVYALHATEEYDDVDVPIAGGVDPPVDIESPAWEQLSRAARGRCGGRGEARQ